MTARIYHLPIVQPHTLVAEMLRRVASEAARQRLGGSVALAAVKSALAEEFSDTAAERLTSPPLPPSPPPPATRGECRVGPRPCPHLTCRHRLLESDVGERAPAGFVLRESCSLDVADREGLTLEAISDVLGVTRERVRQIEFIALRKLKKRGVDLKQYLEQYEERAVL